jgi:hypothetical protein
MSKQEIILMIAFGLAIVFIIFLMAGPQLIYPAEIHGSLEIGWIVELDSLEADIQLSYSPYNFLQIYGGFSVIAEPAEFLHFRPYRNVYEIGANIAITNNIYLDFFHSCTHPVWSNRKQFYDKFEAGEKTEFAVGVRW